MALDGIIHCVACGQRIEPFGDHHCSEEFEKRRQAVNRRAEQDYLNRQPAESTRINFGFYLLSLGGDW